LSDPRHIPVRDVRAYLLGQLDAATADLLEERYFCERTTLLYVRSVEDDLIRDYLQGKLSASERRAFEQRYFGSPDLKQRVEEIRLAMVPPRRVQPVWLAAAAALLLAVGLWFTQTQTVPTTNLVWALSPGSELGAAGKIARVAAPLRSAPVQIRVELRAKAGPNVQARIQWIQVDGARRVVWQSPGTLSTKASASGRTLDLTLNADLFSAEDYVLEILGPDQEALEYFPFSVRR
jgi:hypothetical protein